LAVIESEEKHDEDDAASFDDDEQRHSDALSSTRLSSQHRASSESDMIETETAAAQTRAAPPPPPITHPELTQQTSSTAESAFSEDSFSSFSAPFYANENSSNQPENSTKMFDSYNHSNAPTVETTVTVGRQPNKYCRINFDFTPENDNELGCFSGEYLRIRSIHSGDDWIDCANYYGKTGFVPANFVTFLDDSDPFAVDLFENQLKLPRNHQSSAEELTRRSQVVAFQQSILPSANTIQSNKITSVER
jgi:hypothetical protein